MEQYRKTIQKGLQAVILSDIFVESQEPNQGSLSNFVVHLVVHFGLHVLVSVQNEDLQREKVVIQKGSRFAILQNDQTQNHLLVVEFKIISKVYKNVKIDIQSAIKSLDYKKVSSFFIIIVEISGALFIVRIHYLLSQTKCEEGGRDVNNIWVTTIYSKKYLGWVSSGSSD